MALLLLFLPVLACGPSGGGKAGEGGGRRVLFVGLDGADWQHLDREIAAGHLPNLARLAREGRTGALLTLNPPLSPLVWTTMATGVSPLTHGILDFTRHNPASGRLEPITRFERRVPAVWNLAGARGRSSAVFGLWATWPAEPVRGLLVSDRFFSFTSTAPPAGEGIVHPADREPWAREALARAETKTDLAALRAYLPDLSEEEYQRALEAPDPYAHEVSALRRILVETAVYHDLATSWIAREKPDLSLVYFQGTDTVGHVFAPYAPPQKPGVDAAAFARFSGVPGRYFAEVDRLLGDYRRLAEETGATLMIASDHGFRWSEGRPEGVSAKAAATAGRWHRDEGIYLLWGPGIEPQEERARGEVGQVAATLLALLGLPPRQGMAGPPLPGAPAGLPADAYADVPKEVAEETQRQVPGGEEEVARLTALGYLGGGGSGRRSAANGTRTAASFNHEGLLRRQAGDLPGARRAFEGALALEANNAAALANLSDLLHAQGESARADELLREAAPRLPDGAARLAARAADHLRSGRQHMEAQRCAEAEGDFAAAAQLAPQDPLAVASHGMALLCQGKVEAARPLLRKALALDPEQPAVREALRRMGE